MRIKFFGAILISLIMSNAFYQDEKLNTIILIHHDKKEAAVQDMTNGKDPKLSEDGIKRAERLVALLAKTSVDAVYTTPYIRTRSTVEPLAQSKSLKTIEY